MTDKHPHARLHTFLKNAPVEVESGGKPVRSWWKRKFCTMVLGLGLILGLSTPLANESEQQSHETLIREFRQKLENVRGNRTIVMLDQSHTSKSLSHIFSTVNDHLERDGRRMENPALLKDLQEKAINDELSQGAFFSVVPRRQPDKTDFSLHVILSANPDHTLDDLKSAMLSYPREQWQDMNLSKAEFLRAIYYHELAHGTEPDEWHEPVSADAHAYRLYQMELRADIVSLVGMARDTQGLNTGRHINLFRTTTPFNLTFMVMQSDQKHLLPDIYGYNISQGVSRAMPRIEEQLNTPEGRKKIMSLNDRQVVETGHALFEQVRMEKRVFDQKESAAMFGAVACAQEKLIEIAPGVPAPATFIFRSSPDMAKAIENLLSRIDRAENRLLKKGFRNHRRKAWDTQTRKLKGEPSP
ncbi:MAG TPA: hypothetical protein DCW68_02195 [Rhodospirillaceae bacterium]|nr:MAG: hypothetical protein A2018_05160 [Alphaproteobacteria bacterium GWF2_58_20]HAU28906.1 hypothetical protein [Rhodospirillaceae bacterium]